jgi:hypothetical protein
LVAQPSADPAALAREGIGWVLVERDTPGKVPEELLADLDPVLADGLVELYRVPEAEAGPGARPGAGLVVLADLLVLGVATAAGFGLIRARHRGGLLQ